MMKQPTYSATEILNFCLTVQVTKDTFQTISDLVEEEINLYSEDDLVILMQASMVMFTRCLFFGSMKYL